MPAVTGLVGGAEPSVVKKMRTPCVGGEVSAASVTWISLW